MAAQFEHLNDELSLCTACGVAVADEDQHGQYHAALAELAKSHNQNAKALQAQSDQAEATHVTIVQITELIYDIGKEVTKLQGFSPAEIEEMTREATQALNTLKARVNLPT